MLKPIANTSLNESQKFGAIFRGWIAIDEKTGAMLTRTHGRGKGGLPKYILILPVETLAQRNNDYFSHYNWENKDRKFIRVWSDKKAIEEANKKLEKMLAEREREE